MEEDLKDIELFIDFCRAPYNFEHESDAKSYKELSNKIENLIKSYKELEEENKTLKNVVSEIFNSEDEIGYGKDEVYEKVFEFLKQQIDIKNLYIKTNLNDNRYLIK